MTHEEHFFIKILSDHLHKRTTAPPSQKLEWASLTHLAHAHQVIGIVYTQCKKFIPTEYRGVFERGYSSELYYYANRLAEVQNICNAFQKADIQYYTIKGLDIAQFYPLPPLRTMGDNDIIISSMASATKVMRNLGYDGNYAANNHEWGGSKNNLRIELHDLLVRENEGASRKQFRFFHDFMPHVNDHILDWNYHYLYLIMHLRKHFMLVGIGIRSFMDIAVLINNGPKLDWDWIERQLAYLDLAEFAHVCYSLLETWFGIAAPVSYNNCKTIEEISEKILKNGVFGLADEKNFWVLENRKLLSKRVPTWAKRIALTLSCFFPGYDTMAAYPGCDFLKKRSYLLPVAWFRRFAHLIRRLNLAKAIKAIKYSMKSGKALTGYTDRIKKSGL